VRERNGILFNFPMLVDRWTIATVFETSDGD